MAAVRSLASVVGIQAACAALGVPRSAFYRARHPRGAHAPRPASPRALGRAEREAVLACLHEERFQIARPPLSMPRCWTRATITAPSAPCIGYWPRRGKCASGALSAPIRRTRNPNCWPPRPISSGAGTSPSSRAQPNEPTSICMSCWTSSAATWSAGWWHRAKAPNWRSG